MTNLRATTPEHLGADPGVSRAAGWWRAVLLAALLLLGVATLLTGTRPATYGELQGGIVEGEVTEVGILGAIERTGEGEALVELTWHDGLMRRYAVVEQVVGAQSQSWSSPTSSSDATGVIHGDVAVELRGLAPTDGTLTLTSSDHRSGWGGELYGWKVAGWVAMGGLLMVLPIIVTLVSGPEPRLATRWAWFWLLGAGPIAVLAYVALGLPRAGAPTRPEGSRLTGGWAFLLSIFLPKPWV